MNVYFTLLQLLIICKMLNKMDNDSLNHPANLTNNNHTSFL